MEIKHKIWIEKDGKVFFGTGRDDLFKAIVRHHSISAAVKSEEKVNMSYRAAWGRLKSSQERLGIPLLVSDNKRSGTMLTTEAKILMEFFERLETRVEGIISEATAELQAIFAKEKEG